jgi:DivIVA domain-containing protein
VPLNPTQVHDQAFRIVFRGYDVAAVDDFLDQVQAELTRLMEAQVAKADTADRGSPDSTASEPVATPRSRDDDGAAARALRTLDRAEQMAEQVIAEAAAEGEQLRTAARTEADEVLAAARAESLRLDAELQARHQREVGALVLETQRLRAEIDRLSTLERRCVEGMQAWLAEHQRAIEQHVPIDADVPAAATTLRAEAMDPAA